MRRNEAGSDQNDTLSPSVTPSPDGLLGSPPSEEFPPSEGFEGIPPSEGFEEFEGFEGFEGLLPLPCELPLS